MEKPFEETHRDSNPDPPESLYLTVVVCFTCKSNWSNLTFVFLWSMPQRSTPLPLIGHLVF